MCYCWLSGCVLYLFAFLLVDKMSWLNYQSFKREVRLTLWHWPWLFRQKWRNAIINSSNVRGIFLISISLFGAEYVEVMSKIYQTFFHIQLSSYVCSSPWYFPIGCYSKQVVKNFVWWKQNASHFSKYDGNSRFRT